MKVCMYAANSIIPLKIKKNSHEKALPSHISFPFFIMFLSPFHPPAETITRSSSLILTTHPPSPRSGQTSPSTPSYAHISLPSKSQPLIKYLVQIQLHPGWNEAPGTKTTFEWRRRQRLISEESFFLNTYWHRVNTSSAGIGHLRSQWKRLIIPIIEFASKQAH